MPHTRHDVAVITFLNTVSEKRCRAQCSCGWISVELAERGGAHAHGLEHKRTMRDLAPAGADAQGSAPARGAADEAAPLPLRQGPQGCAPNVGCARAYSL